MPTMCIAGADINTYYVALTSVVGGKFGESWVLPKDGPDWKAESLKPKARRSPYPEAPERLRLIFEAFKDIPFTNFSSDFEWIYIEDPPFVNSAKVLKELQSVLAVLLAACWERGIEASVVNVSTWKKETIGNSKATKAEIRRWTLAHVPGIPKDLIEDQYDAAAIAMRGSIAAGDVKRETKKRRTK